MRKTSKHRQFVNDSSLRLTISEAPGGFPFKTYLFPELNFQAALETAPSNFTPANFTGVGLGGAVLASQECSLQERAWRLSVPTWRMFQNNKGSLFTKQETLEGAPNFESQIKILSLHPRQNPKEGTPCMATAVIKTLVISCI